MKEKQPTYWRGKLFGALIGLMLGHGLWIAVFIGFLIGHWIDKTRTRIYIIHQRAYAYQSAYARQQYYRQHTVHTTQKSSLQEAYDILGVDSSVNDATLKKAYRRLMSRHHPDKLIAQNASEKEIEIAKQKTQTISVAYENIVQHRKGYQ